MYYLFMEESEMSDNGFKIVPDKYFRGNGRWAKVVRLHDKTSIDTNGVQRWHRKYSVACGYDGQFVADPNRMSTYGKRNRAESVAKDWIDYEG
jgi:hypothetical protein